MLRLVLVCTLALSTITIGWSQITVDFSVNENEGCGTLQAQFTDLSSSTEGAIQSWFWELGNAITSELPSPGRVFTESGSYEICLTVKDAEGNSSKTCKSNFVTIHELPRVDFTAAPIEGCIPMDVSFENKTIADNPISEVIWDLGGEAGVLQGGPELNVVEGQYLTVDEYSISLIVRDVKGCISSLSKPGLIKAGSLDKPSVTASEPIGCVAPHSTSFTVSDISPGIVYTWDFGNGVIYTGPQPPEQQFAEPGAYEVSVAAVDTSYGCRDTFFYAGLVNVGLQGLPSVDKYVGCIGTPFAFSDIAYTGVEGLLWDFGNGVTSNKTSPTYRYNQSGCYQVSLVKQYSGCQTVTLLDTCIEVLAKPDLNLIADRASTCVLPAEFNLSITGPAVDNIRWYVHGLTYASNVSQLTITSDTLGPVPVEVRARFLDGCQLRTFDTLFVGSLDLDVPEVSLSGCVPTTANLTNPVSNGFELVQWQWTLFTDPPQVSFVEAPVFQLSGAGSFDLQLIATSAEGCVDTASGKSSVSAGFPPDFTMSSDVSTTCADSAVQFSSDFTTPVSSTLWTFGDGETSQKKNPKHEYQDTGVFTVILEASYNGCKEIDSLAQQIQIPGPVSQFDVQVDCATRTLSLVDESIASQQTRYEILQDDTVFAVGNQGDTTFQMTDDGWYEIIQYTENLETGCTDTYVDSVYIGQVPPVLEYSVMSGCAPLNIDIVNKSKYIEAWNWSATGAIISDDTVANPTLTFPEPGVYNGLSVEYQDANGCFGEFELNVEFIIGGVAPELTDTTYVACPDGDIYLEDMAGGDITVDSWQWIIGDTAMMSYDSLPHITALLPGYYDLLLRTVDSLGCSSSASMDSVIHIYDPDLQFIGDTVTCLGVTSQYRLKSPIDGVTYKWEIGDSSVYYGNRANHVFDQLGTYNLCISIMNADGCDSLLCKQIDVVEFNAAFAADTLFDSCPPLIVNFENQSLSATSFEWFFGDNSGASAIEDPSHVYTVPGKYDVSLVAELTQKCRDTLTLEDLVIVEGPEGEFSYELEGDCLPVEAIFNATSIDAYNYIWDFGDGQLDSTAGRVLQDSAYYTFDRRGGYLPRLTLIDTLDCRHTLVGKNTIEVNGEFLQVGLDTNICVGEILNLRPEVLGGTVNWQAHPLISDPLALDQDVKPVESTIFVLEGVEGDCFETDSMFVGIFENVDIHVMDQVICFGDSIQLTADGNALEFEWLVEEDLPILFGSDNSIQVAPAQTTTYTTIGYKSICKPDTVTSTVYVYGNFEYQLPESSVIYLDEVYEVPLTIGDQSILIEWIPSSAVSCATCPEPVVLTDSTMMLYVQFTEPVEGCLVQDSIMLRFPQSCSGTYAYVPNVFTPNGDGVNDFVRLESDKFEELIDFSVFDRWGMSVYSSDDIGFEWDGTYQGEILTPGVYVYRMQLICPMNGKPLDVTGSITLLR